MPTRFAPNGQARDELRAAIEEQAATGRCFTRDNIVRPKGATDNQVGSAFAAARKRGIIRQVGVTKTRRRVGNRRQLAVWVGTGSTGGTS